MILGIDPGERRVGIAIADKETGFARPLEVIDAAKTDAVMRILQIVGEWDVQQIVVGRPISLSGRAGPAVAGQQEFVKRLRAATKLSVREHDERFTTVVAEMQLRAAGADAGARRRMRDAIAAQVMLQGFLDQMDEGV